MKNTVNALKRKHRDYIWRDEEGDLWYWDSIRLKWVTLMADFDGGFYVSDQHDHKYYNQFDRIVGSVLAYHNKK